MNMEASTFKSAIRSEDLTLIAKGVREMKASGVTLREMYRLALAANPNLDLHTFEDMVVLACEKNPVFQVKPLTPKGRIAKHPVGEWASKEDAEKHKLSLEKYNLGKRYVVVEAS